ncbi:unnamed protein product, partial [Mesorhabditis spiculigera]
MRSQDRNMRKPTLRHREDRREIRREGRREEQQEGEEPSTPMSPLNRGLVNPFRYKDHELPKPGPTNDPAPPKKTTTPPIPPAPSTPAPPADDPEPPRLQKSVEETIRLDRWFLTRFSIDNPYEGLQQEFTSLQRDPWMEDTVDDSPFLEQQIGDENVKQYKCYGQYVPSIYRTPGFIACEGPNGKSVFDFWMLIYREKIERIFSVNFPFEERLHHDGDPVDKPVVKETVQYWPMVPGAVFYFMPFKITCITSVLKYAPNVLSHDNSNVVYRVSRLMVEMDNPMKMTTEGMSEEEPDDSSWHEELAPQNNPNGEKHEVTHVCYLRWPDGRVPMPWPQGRDTYKDAGCRLVDIMLEELSSESETPIVIHCHAGIGRTGVAIALLMALEQFHETKGTNIKGLVTYLRCYRPRSVMNHWQYAYINVLFAQKLLRAGHISETIGGHKSQDLLDKVWDQMEAIIDRVNAKYDSFLTYFYEIGVKV